MKICIISDIHCSKEKGGTNLFYSNIPDRPISQNPLSSFLKIMESDPEIKSDIVICLGDLGHQAYDKGIKIAWDSIERIKNEMNCKIKIGIPGNHDIDSRKIYNKNPNEYIQNFSLNFPTPVKNLNSKFWADGFCLYENENCEILMINTVHDHKDAESAKISIINEVTLENIEDELKMDIDKVKLCILHHHPIKHTDISNWNDTDSLEKGDKLLALLNRFNYDIVIHGHKHQPRVCELNGLTILAAGSFSCFENLQATGTSTMFHIVDIEGQGKGKILSWEFNYQKGWAKNQNHNFPPEIGFGETKDINLIANEINQLFAKNLNKPLLYEKIINEIPELSYIIPEKLIRLRNILNTRYNLFMEPNFPLKPYIITSN